MDKFSNDDKAHKRTKKFVFRLHIFISIRVKRDKKTNSMKQTSEIASFGTNEYQSKCSSNVRIFIIGIFFFHPCCVCSVAIAERIPSTKELHKKKKINTERNSRHKHNLISTYTYITELHALIVFCLSLFFFLAHFSL